MFLRMLASFLLALSPVMAAAAPVPKDPGKGMPQVVVQFKPIDGLRADYKLVTDKLKDIPDLAGVLNKTTFDQLLGRLLADWEKGVDPGKPLGGYLTLEGDGEKSRPVFLVPVKGEKVFLEVVGKTSGKFSEVKDRGYYSGTMMGQEVFVRFKNNYAFITPENADAIDDPAKLPIPADLLLKEETALAGVRMYIEGAPEELKKKALQVLHELDQRMQDGNCGAFGLGGQELLLLIMIGGGTNLKEIVENLKLVVDEAKWATLRFEIDPKRTALDIELNLVPKKDTELVKKITAFNPSRSRLPGLFDGATAAGAMFSFGSFDWLRQNNLEQLVGGVLGGALGLDGDAKDMAELSKAIMSTVNDKKARASLAVALKHTSGKKTYTLVAGTKVNQAKDFESAVLAYMKTLPKEKRERFVPAAVKLDGDIAIHKITFKEFPDDAKKILGEGTAWFVVKDDTVFVAVGNEGVERLKECLKLPEQASPHLLIEANPQLFNPLIKAVDNAEHAEALGKLFPKNETSRLLRGDVEGGAMLRVRYSAEIIPLVKIGLFGSRLGP